MIWIDVCVVFSRDHIQVLQVLAGLKDLKSISTAPKH